MVNERMQHLAGIKRSPIQEAHYPGCLGFEEIMKFYQKASKSDIVKFERYAEDDDTENAWNLLKKVLKITWDLR